MAGARVIGTNVAPLATESQTTAAQAFGPGLFLAVVVIGQRERLSGGEVGTLVAAFGACLLVGSFVSPLVRRLLPVRAVLLLELWTWMGCAVFLV